MTQRERGSASRIREPSRYTKKRLCYTGARSSPRSSQSRAETKRRLTGTESHQSRRAGLRGVERTETQTEGAHGGRRRDAHALGRARRTAGDVSESSAHGRAEKNISIIRGVEITHCVRSPHEVSVPVVSRRVRSFDPRERRVRLRRRLESSSHARRRRASRGHRHASSRRALMRRAIHRPAPSPRAPGRGTKPRDRRFRRRRVSRARLVASRSHTHAPTLDKLGARSITGYAGTPPTTPIARRRPSRARVCRSSGPLGTSALGRAFDRVLDCARVGRRAFESSIVRAREETRATSRIATTPRGTDSIDF